jgi:hypothetical protein
MRRIALPALILAALSVACGGGSGGGSGGSGSGGGTTTTNPCTTAAATAGDDVPVEVPAERPPKTGQLDPNPRWRVLDALWTNRAARDRRARSQTAETPETPPRHSADVGEIAVVQDEGDLIVAPNTYDLRSLGLRFSRNGSGGYDVRRIDGNFRATLGTRLNLGDDDSARVNVPFTFSFYGKGQTAAFVNSDGNITFEEADQSSTERNVARLLTGPPRVAPFLADLDPTAGGRIFVQAVSDQYTVTWCSVRGFDSTRTTTVQASLFPDGTIEFKYGSTITLSDTISAISPGHTGDFTPVNLSDNGPTGGGSGAVGERFSAQAQIDNVELSRKFFRSHPDNYDQIVVWTDAPLTTDAFAFEFTVQNEITGIGVDIYNLSNEFGSTGRLRSFVMMDFIGKYPDDPGQRFLGENNTVSVLGQESGHRWLAFLNIRDRTGAQSDVLLGRDRAHWSFFFDSDASVMEGNDIEDLGGGSFRTVGAVRRYSLLDQYAMGLVPDTAVPPFFYVESPTNVSNNATRDSAPQVGVTFNGTRRDVLIQDVIAIHGPRTPTVAQSSKVHRQAFIYVVSAGRSPDSSQITKIDNIRRQWESFFLQATDGRMTANTRLQ